MSLHCLDGSLDFSGGSAAGSGGAAGGSVWIEAGSLRGGEGASIDVRGGAGQGMTKLNFGSSGSDVSRAATFGSASECSTPFISPHGTPIPFNRSRHNSAQGRLCSRSRHSSGLGPYR